MNAQQAAAVNGLVAAVNGAIAGAAGATGATYVDASASFENHRRCDKSPRLYDLNTPNSAFHPTAAGQRAYAQAINQAGFREAVRPGNRAAAAVG